MTDGREEVRNVRNVPTGPVDRPALAAQYGHMFFRVLERYAPSRVLLVLVAIVGTTIFGLKFGVVLLLAVAVYEVGLWLDRYGQS